MIGLIAIFVIGVLLTLALWAYVWAYRLARRKGKGGAAASAWGISGFVLFFVAGNTHAATERYRYQLEDGAHNEVCRHMTQVFNTRFKTPWDKGKLGSEPIPKIHGTPYDQVFERMPGVEYKKDFVYSMLLSKYPTSTEFEAVKWRETRVKPESNSIVSEYPALITQLDIDNDGQLDWVVKHLFMDKITTFEGWGQAWGGNDHLLIFPLNGFESVVPIPIETLIPLKNPSKAPRSVDERISESLDASQLRPFIFKNKTYLSAYQVFWKFTENAGHTLPRPPYKEYPDREYMNIFAVLPGGFRKEGFESVTLPVNTEMLCRISMHMQK